MKKLFIIVLGALLVISCGTTSNLPSWFVTTRESKDGMYATGSASLKTTEASMMLAEANAISALNRQIDTLARDVRQAINSSSQEQSIAGIDANALQVSENHIIGWKRTNMAIIGSTVYIEVYMPYESVVKNVSQKTGISQEYLLTEVKMKDAYEKYFSEESTVFN